MRWVMSGWADHIELRVGAPDTLLCSVIPRFLSTPFGAVPESDAER